jgi:hypothetical protein
VRNLTAAAASRGGPGVSRKETQTVLGRRLGFSRDAQPQRTYVRRRGAPCMAGEHWVQGGQKARAAIMAMTAGCMARALPVQARARAAATDKRPLGSCHWRGGCGGTATAEPPAGVPEQPGGKIGLPLAKRPQANFPACPAPNPLGDAQGRLGLGEIWVCVCPCDRARR